MDDRIGRLLLSDIAREFASQRKLAERAVAQLTDDEFMRVLGAEENSVAIVMKHVGGNLRSRWTDFLTADGEKPDRNRDGEFELQSESREAVTHIWETGFATLDASLAALTPADLLATVRIRSEPMPAVQALNRALAHTAQHVGQIILLARHWRGASWQTISIPRTRQNR
ncbi:MAG: DUF1572 family protein [Gemmatimonadota bacterium]